MDKEVVYIFTKVCPCLHPHSAWVVMDAVDLSCCWIQGSVPQPLPLRWLQLFLFINRTHLGDPMPVASNWVPRGEREEVQTWRSVWVLKWDPSSWHLTCRGMPSWACFFWPLPTHPTPLPDSFHWGRSAILPFLTQIPTLPGGGECQAIHLGPGMAPAMVISSTWPASAQKSNSSLMVAFCKASCKLQQVWTWVCSSTTWLLLLTELWPLKFICRSSNPQDLRVWLYLETGSLKRWLSLNKVIEVSLDLIRLMSL